MKYIRENGAISIKQTDTLGIALACFYLFFSFLGGSILPSWLNKVSLISLLGYGAITVFYKLIKGTFCLSKYSIWYLIFGCCSLLTLTYSEYSHLEINHFYQIVVSFVVTLFLMEYIRTEKDFCLACWSYIISSFLMIAVLFATGRLVGSHVDRLGNEVSGNANIFATFMMYSILYSSWLLIYKDYRFYIKIFLCGNIISNIYALMLSGGKKFFAIPFIFIYILLLSKKDKDSKKHIIKYTVLVVIIIFAFYYLIMNIPMLYDAIGIRIKQFTNQYTGEGVVDGSSKERAIMRATAIEKWFERPFFGYGLDTFKYLKTPNLSAHHAYSHCNFTELLYSGGVFLFLVYYALFAFVVMKICCMKNKESKYTAFTIAAIISQFILDYGGVFYDVLTAQIFLMMAVWCLEFQEQNNEIQINNMGESKYGKDKNINPRDIR